MQTNLFWQGIEYQSLENCVVHTTDSGSEINAVIVGKYGEAIYSVTYKIVTNEHWETRHVTVQGQHSNIRDHLTLEHDGNGSWIMNGEKATQFDGCSDVDIPLTPFTNTLPINRLKLNHDESRVIQVVYIDVLARQIIPVKQKYTCRSGTRYHYENVPNDFEAIIEVDEQGFVVDYPALFVRAGKLLSNY